MRQGSFLLLLVTIVALCGCSSLKQSSLKNKPQNTMHSSELNRWWKIMKDPLMDKLADELLSENLDIKIAKVRVEEARFLTQILNAELFPEISANASGSIDSMQIGSPKKVNILQGGFDTSWEVDLFGRKKSASHASKFRHEAAIASAEDICNSALADLFRAIIYWRQMNMTVNKVKAILTLYDTQIKLLKNRFNAGLNDETLIQISRAERNKIAIQLSSAKASLNIAEYQIERLLGKDPGELSGLLKENHRNNLQVPSVEKTLTIKAESIRLRPDIRAEQLQMIAAESELKKAEAELWPTLNIGSFFGVQDVSKGTITPGNPISSLTASITLPILNFGRLRGAVKMANAKAMVALLAYENAALIALHEAKAALVDYLAATHAVNEQEGVCKSLRSVVKLATASFEQGLSDMINLTIAEIELNKALIDLIAKKSAVSVSYIRLQKAIGTSFSPIIAD